MNFYMFIYKVFIKKTLYKIRLLQLKSLFLIFFFSSVLILSTAISASIDPFGKTAGAEKNGATANNPYVGVNMRGFYTSMSQSKNYSNFPPNNYFEDSFKLISQAGMNHVRFVFNWEAYEKDPVSFMKELAIVADTADKWGINVLYDNHQWHTSSWFDPQRAKGFPISLFQNTPAKYKAASGGDTENQGAKLWWSDWWNRSVRGSNGTDGWTLQLQFLKKIVSAVDDHKSTLGYEILSEPQIHSNDEWEKVGKFNTFMVNGLRPLTDKTIAFSQQVPTSLNDPYVKVSAENMVKMTPSNKTNVVYAISSGYGIPIPGTYHGSRLDTYLKTGELAAIPVYVAEWNSVIRQNMTNKEGRTVFEINPAISELNQTTANYIIQRFKEGKVWGMAYWLWNFKQHEVPNFNLINSSSGTIHPTKYFQILKIAIDNAYGNISATGS